MIKALLSILTLLAAFSTASVAASGAFFLNSASQIALNSLQEDWSPGEYKVLDREDFTLHYPKNWELATEQEGYDPDRLFTLQAANGESYITIKFFVPDANTNAEDLIDSLQLTLDGPIIDTYSRDSFNTWGSLKGKGLHLKGKIAGFLPGGARIFVSTDDGKGILVTELYYSEELAQVFPGFDLIRNSFSFKD